MFLKKRIFKVSFNKTYQSQPNRSRNLKKDKTKRFFETKNNKFQKFHLTIQCQSEAESYKRDKRNVNITFLQKKTKNKKKFRFETLLTQEAQCQSRGCYLQKKVSKLLFETYPSNKSTKWKLRGDLQEKNEMLI